MSKIGSQKPARRPTDAESYRPGFDPVETRRAEKAAPALLSFARMEGGVPPEVLTKQDITAEGACLAGSMRLPPAEPPNNCRFCSPSYVSPHRYFFPQYFMQMLYSLLQASRV